MKTTVTPRSALLSFLSLALMSLAACTGDALGDDELGESEEVGESEEALGSGCTPCKNAGGCSSPGVCLRASFGSSCSSEGSTKSSTENVAPESNISSVDIGSFITTDDGVTCSRKITQHAHKKVQKSSICKKSGKSLKWFTTTWGLRGSGKSVKRSTHEVVGKFGNSNLCMSAGTLGVWSSWTND